MYSPSSPEFQPKQNLTPRSTSSLLSLSPRHTKSPNYSNTNNRDILLPSIPSLLSTGDDDDESCYTEGSRSSTSIAHRQDLRRSSRRSSSNRRLKPQFEKTLLQAHGLTRALFACVPCQSLDGGGGRARSHHNNMPSRAETGSYYLPSDVLDDAEILPYFGADADDITGHMERRYDVKRA
ncbi:hypothetical protein ACA910_017777 [Epithemia clementina (nom. ined.)]